MEKIFQYRNRRVGLAGIVCLTSIVVCGYFFPIVLHPDSYFFATGGDATKNYYVPAYYSKYDSGLRFTGMNYPYGENILYTDGSFPVSWMLQKLEHSGIPLTDNTTAVINYLILISIVLCGVFLFLLLHEFGIATLFAVSFSLCITMLAPQVQRIIAHYSMAHLWFIPAMLFFIFKIIYDQKKLKWLLSGLLLSLFYGFMHLYNTAVISALIFSIAVFYCFPFFRKNIFSWKIFSFLLTLAFIPLLLLQGFIAFTDTVHDRIKVPWGFDFSFATRKSVFIPPDWNPFNFYPNDQLYQEGYNYVGLVAIAAIAFYLVYLISVLLKRPVFGFLKAVHPFVVLLVFASVPVLLHSMCIPWKYDFIRPVVDEYSVLSQFRALGRFGWDFYFAASILSAVVLSTLIKYFLTVKKIYVAVTLFVVNSFVWSREGRANFYQVKKYHQDTKVADSYWKNPSYYNALASAGYHPQDFQSMIGLPFFHKGSEKFWIEASWSAEEAFKISYNLHLPMCNAYLGRTSLSETENIIQLSSNDLIEKNILNDFPNGKPLLVFYTGEPLTENQKSFLSKCDSITKAETVTFYKLDLNKLKTDYTQVRTKFITQKDSLYDEKYLATTDSLNQIIYKSFSSENNSFLKKGTYYDSAKVILYSGQIRAQRGSTPYEVSVWEKIYRDTYDFAWFNFKQYNENGILVNEQNFTGNNSTDIFNGWMQLKYSFITSGRNDSIVCSLRGKFLEFSELLIKPQKAEVYTHLNSNGSFVVNNYFIPANH